MKQYINGVFEKVKARNAHEPEFPTSSRRGFFVFS